MNIVFVFFGVRGGGVGCFFFKVIRLMIDEGR